ncbi:MAG: hypothetical protein K2J34_08430, partial [Muribaculaceae bacterium]|nr:hypothetical protein [Muribaculaceae bacterium]
RGIGTVFISLYSNFMMALGHGRQIVTVEIVKDSTTAIALIATVFSMSLEALVWGQLAATLATWAIAGIIAARTTGYSVGALAKDLLPFASAAAAAAAAIWAVPVPTGDISHWLNPVSLAGLAIQAAAGVAAVFITLGALRVPEMAEIKEKALKAIGKQSKV